MENAEPVEVAEEPQTPGAEEAEEPQTPWPAPRARKNVKVTVPPALTLDANFWGEMLNTKRAMEKEETKRRYSNLVVFK